MVGVDSSCSFSTNHGIDKTGQLAWMLVTDLLNPIPTFCLFVLNFDPLSSTTFVSLAGSVMTTNDPVIMRLSSNVLTEQHSLCFFVSFTPKAQFHGSIWQQEPSPEQKLQISSDSSIFHIVSIKCTTVMRLFTTSFFKCMASHFGDILPLSFLQRCSEFVGWLFTMFFLKCLVLYFDSTFH